MKCPNCGSDNLGVSKFCGNCGAKLPLNWSPSLGRLTKKQDNIIRLAVYLAFTACVAGYVGFRIAKNEPVFTEDSAPLFFMYILLTVLFVFIMIFKRK